MTQLRAKAIVHENLKVIPPKLGAKVGDEELRKIVRRFAKYCKQVSRDIARAQSRADEDVNLEQIVHTIRRHDSENFSSDAALLFERALREIRQCGSDKLATELCRIKSELDTVGVLVKRCNANIQLSSTYASQICSQVVNNMMVLSQASELLGNVHILVFAAVSVPDNLVNIPACAALLVATERSLQAGADIIAAYNAMSNLEQEVVKLVQGLVSFVSDFTARMTQVFDATASKASITSGTDLADIVFNLTPTQGQAMLYGVGNANDGYQGWVTATNPPPPNQFWPANKGNGGQPTTQFYTDYWDNLGLASPTALLEASQYFGVVDMPGGVPIANAPTAAPTNGVLNEEYNWVTNQATGQQPYDSGNNICFLFTDSGAIYSGVGTTNGAVNNALELPSDLFNFLPTSLKSKQLVSLNCNSDAAAGSPGAVNYTTNANLGSPVAYLSMSGILNVCDSVMNLAGAFVPTQAYDGTFNSAFGTGASYKSLSTIISSINSIGPAVASAPNTAQQNAQTVVSAVISLLQNLVNSILPNFRFDF